MLSVSSGAATNIVTIIKKDDQTFSEDILLTRSDISNSSEKRFRVKVLSGGCSGYQYKFSIDESRDEDDIVFSAGAFEVIVDKHSLPLIEGSMIEHSSSLGGEYFYIKNPNAKASCGCGNSFST